MCIIKSHTFINHPLLRLVIQKREINMHRDIQILSIYQFICISLYGNPIQYSCLENPMDRGAWQTTVHRVSKSQTWLKRQHMRMRAHTHTHTHTHIFLSIYLSIYLGASQMAQMVKNLPAIWETRVRSLGQKDPLKKQMATHSNIPLWGIPWMQESGRLQFLGSQRVRHDWATNTFTTICLSIDHLSVLQELGR